MVGVSQRKRSLEELYQSGADDFPADAFESPGGGVQVGDCGISPEEWLYYGGKIGTAVSAPGCEVALLMPLQVQFVQSGQLVRDARGVIATAVHWMLNRFSRNVESLVATANLRRTDCRTGLIRGKPYTTMPRVAVVFSTEPSFWERNLGTVHVGVYSKNEAAMLVQIAGTNRFCYCASVRDVPEGVLLIKAPVPPKFLGAFFDCSCPCFAVEGARLLKTLFSSGAALPARLFVYTEDAKEEVRRIPRLCECVTGSKRYDDSQHGAALAAACMPPDAVGALNRGKERRGITLRFKRVRPSFGVGSREELRASNERLLEASLQEGPPPEAMSFPVQPYEAGVTSCCCQWVPLEVARRWWEKKRECPLCKSGECRVWAPTPARDVPERREGECLVSYVDRIPEGCSESDLRDRLGHDAVVRASEQDVPHLLRRSFGRTDVLVVVSV